MVLIVHYVIFSWFGLLKARRFTANGSKPVRQTALVVVELALSWIFINFPYHEQVITITIRSRPSPLPSPIWKSPCG